MGEIPEVNSCAVRCRRRWWHLHQRWSMLGVFEITPDHDFYHLTSLIREGARVSIQKGLTTAAPGQLREEDFTAQDTQTHKGFEMQTFAAPVFVKLRRSLDISEEDYLNSLCSEQHYLQFISNSKSKADFFVTHDKRFFLKTQSRCEVQFLLSKLKAYVDHLEKYPHSLMVRFLGVYRILIPNEIKKYFIVMQSVFYPDERIDIRYDIKGCEVGRWTDPDTGGRHIIKVLKDKNFRGQTITLGSDKQWFVDQVRADTAFLQQLHVLDYSLLLADQPLHMDELDKRHSLADIVLRATKSLDLDNGPSEPDRPTAPLLPQASGGTTSPRADLPESIPLELQEFRQHHRRLLPTYKNAVHMIDGPNKRYFVGIIDIFTVYGWKKKLEHIWKRLRFSRRTFSTVSPEKYSHRFCTWIQEHTV